MLTDLLLLDDAELSALAALNLANFCADAMCRPLVMREGAGKALVGVLRKGGLDVQKVVLQVRHRPRQYRHVREDRRFRKDHPEKSTPLASLMCASQWEGLADDRHPLPLWVWWCFRRSCIWCRVGLPSTA